MQTQLFSKRRRAKRTRLRQGGSMTLEEGQELQDQKCNERQVQCYMQQSSGRKNVLRVKSKGNGKDKRKGKKKVLDEDEDEDEDELSPVISQQMQA